MKENKKKLDRSFIPKKIGEHLKGLNSKFSSKFGKIEYLIHLKWPQIVGPFFSNHSEPLKITSIKNYDNPNEENVFLNYLHVNVTPASALEFQHFKDKIVEKINSYFGYKAINGLKITQNYTPINENYKKNFKNKLQTIEEKNEVKKQTKNINNNDLEESIVKLGLSISKDNN